MTNVRSVSPDHAICPLILPLSVPPLSPHRYISLVPLRSFLLMGGLVVALLITTASAFTVVIDAGHGGHDSGATNGLVYEKHLALDVSRRLARYLNKRGVRTTYTRSSNRFVSLSDRVAVANRQRDAVFVSIHFNSAANRGATGIETFYYTPQSELLAHLVQANAISMTGKADRGVKYRGFHVIRNTRCPAVLVEGGFLSNNRECSRCVDKVHRQRLAEAIGNALLRFRQVR